MNLKLVPTTLSHIPHIMRWVNDPQVMQYFAEHQKPISEHEERLFMLTLLKSKNDRIFSIFDGDEYIGQCSLNAIYWPARNARMFIVILPEHQHKGYGPAAIQQLLKIAFGEGLNLHKVWLIVRKDNRAAQAMYLKQGFFFEGTLLDEYCVNGEFYDMVRMSILTGERTTVRKEHLDELLTRSNRLHDVESRKRRTLARVTSKNSDDLFVILPGWDDAVSIRMAKEMFPLGMFEQMSMGARFYVRATLGVDSAESMEFDGIENPFDLVCSGCGLRDLHKMCPAHGTVAYMNRSHPAWGNEDAIKALKRGKNHDESRP